MSCPVNLFPITQNCSGHGICREDLSICECEPNWSGQGDFAFRDSANCGVHLPTIQALWILFAAISFFGGVPVVLYFFMRKFYKSNWSRKKVDLTSAPFIGGYCGLITFTLNVVIGVLHATYPTKVVGTDPQLTILVSFSTSFYWFSALVFIYIFFETVKMNARIFSKTSQKINPIISKDYIKRTLFLLSILTTFCNFTPCGSLTSTSVNQNYIFGLLFYVGIAINALIVGAGLFYRYSLIIQKEIQHVLDNNGVAHSSENLILVKTMTKLSKITEYFPFIIPMNVVSTVVAGVWPFMQIVGSAYLFPVGWGSGCVTLMMVFYVNTPTSKETTSKEVSTTPQFSTNNKKVVVGVDSSKEDEQKNNSG